MQKGTQIAYVPTHVGGNLKHPDVEFGFVMSKRGDAYFCRYWRKGHLGDLRTKANSELTPQDLLIRYESVDQLLVDNLIQQIEREMLDGCS